MQKKGLYITHTTVEKERKKCLLCGVLHRCVPAVAHEICLYSMSFQWMSKKAKVLHTVEYSGVTVPACL